MKAYIAGPISGIEDYARNFQRAEDLIRHARPDWVPVSPVKIPPVPHDGECPPGRPGLYGHNEACHLRGDIAELVTCGAIVLLSGWTQSIGARLEFQVAVHCGLRKYEMDGLMSGREIDMVGRLSDVGL